MNLSLNSVCVLLLCIVSITQFKYMYIVICTDPSDLVSGDGNETTSTTTGGGGRKRSKVTSSSSGSKGRKGSSSEGVAAGETASIGGRDNALFLFRALGKILYCKR